MRRADATENLKVTGWLMIFVGLLGMLGASAYWKIDGAITSGFKILFGLAFIYFGYLILSSARALTGNP